jgi:hypothetical protein
MNEQRVSVEQYVASGAMLSRRGKPVSVSYVYRLIRQYNKGLRTTLPFKFVFTGEKERVWIVG